MNCPSPKKSRAMTKPTREIFPVYWRKLIEVGVPIEAAKVIAWTIASYDRAQKTPPRHRQIIISHYCRFICRAELWRAGLLDPAM